MRANVVVMGPVAAVKSSLFKVFQLNTRAGRSEFWWTFLILFGITCLSICVQIVVKQRSEELRVLSDLLSSVGAFYYIGLFGYFLSICIRRLHDTNRNGFNLLYLLLPAGIGLIVVPIMLAQKGTIGFNKYGPDAEQEEAILAKAIYDKAEEFG